MVFTLCTCFRSSLLQCGSGPKELGTQWICLHGKSLFIKHYSVEIIFIIIVSCHHHGYLWPSLAIPPYRSSLLAGHQGYISYQHRAAVRRFERVTLLLLGQLRGSIGEQPITKTIKVRQTRHAGHCWRSWDELISDVLLWILSHIRWNRWLKIRGTEWESNSW